MLQNLCKKLLGVQDLTFNDQIGSTVPPQYSGEYKGLFFFSSVGPYALSETLKGRCHDFSLKSSPMRENRDFVIILNFCTFCTFVIILNFCTFFTKNRRTTYLHFFVTYRTNSKC
jgi:hypothetical protein